MKGRRDSLMSHVSLHTNESCVSLYVMYSKLEKKILRLIDEASSWLSHESCLTAYNWVLCLIMCIQKWGGETCNVDTWKVILTLSCVMSHCIQMSPLSLILCCGSQKTILRLIDERSSWLSHESCLTAYKWVFCFTICYVFKIGKTTNRLIDYGSCVTLSLEHRKKLARLMVSLLLPTQGNSRRVYA